MRTTFGLRLLFWVPLSAAGAGAGADELVLADGQRSEVRAFELGERSVRTVTLSGKSWSLLIDAVNVPATREANGMGPDDRRSPSWPRPPRAMPRPEAPGASIAPAPPPSPTHTRPQRERPRPRPRPPPPPRPRTGFTPPEPEPEPLPALRPEPRRLRFAIFVNGVAGSDGIALGESRTFDLFSESASLDTSYQEASRPGYEVGALVRLAGPLGVMASAELFEPSPTARYRALVPHPYFYDRPRELLGERSDLFRHELAVHVSPTLTLQYGSRLHVDLFSGVSWFRTETDVVDEILYDEVFPFDRLAGGGTTLRRIEDRPLGFNVGGSVTLRVVSALGVDFAVRYSRATARLALDDERELTFDAGGLRLGAGLRFLFP